MKLLRNEEIDMKKWDGVILNSDFPLVFAQSFYLNATSPGWSALVFKDYHAVFPVTAGSRMTIRYLMQPPFTSQLGLFGDFTQNMLEECLSHVNREFGYVDIELNAGNRISDEKARQKHTYVLNLEQEVAFNANTLRNISKAVKSGMTVRQCNASESRKLSESLIQPFLKNKIRLAPKICRRFRDLIESSLDAGHLFSFGCNNSKGETKAFAHYVSNGRHALYLKGVNLDKQSGGMHQLMAHAIGYFREQGVGQFDFGGGQSESLARFFQGFGGSLLCYPVFRYNRLPAPLRWIKK
jgi:hypothetical protein